MATRMPRQLRGDAFDDHFQGEKSEKRIPNATTAMMGERHEGQDTRSISGSKNDRKLGKGPRV